MMYAFIFLLSIFTLQIDLLCLHQLLTLTILPPNFPPTPFCDLQRF